MRYGLRGIRVTSDQCVYLRWMYGVAAVIGGRVQTPGSEGVSVEVGLATTPTYMLVAGIDW